MNKQEMIEAILEIDQSNVDGMGYSELKETLIDMYRLMLEEHMTQEEVELEYKEYTSIEDEE